MHSCCVVCSFRHTFASVHSVLCLLSVAGLPPDPELMSQALACRSAELAVETDELSRHIASLQRAHLQHTMAHAGLQGGGASSGGAPQVYRQVRNESILA